MTFACGADAAIAELLGNHYDVVVSDIRMSGVDGVHVLQYAKDQHPEAIRIALTGYSDRENTIKLTSLAQRYLTKPCNIDELEKAISRDTELIDALQPRFFNWQILSSSAGKNQWTQPSTRLAI